MEYSQKSDEKIEVLSKEQVDEAVRKMIDPQRMIIITAGDFESVQEESSDDTEADSDSTPAAAGAGN